MIYQFSAPMPYTPEDINRMLDINNHVEKSKITSLYACLPSNCELFTGFEQPRNFAFEHNNWEYWKKLIEHTLSHNSDFIYLLNSPRPLDIENPNFKQQLEKLEKLLAELKILGVKKLRVALPQLQTWIGENYNYFDILASTSMEYKTIWEYQNFIHFHEEVKQIVPSSDVNKNFKLLSILREKYPDKEIEIMVNEACLQGCPHRAFHETTNIDKHFRFNDNVCFSTDYGTSFCMNIKNRYPIQSLIIGSNVFPWEIEEYKKIGITKFKLVGRDAFNNNIGYCIDNFALYLRGVENIKNIEEYPLIRFTHHLYNTPVLGNLKVKEYQKYLPKIKHFTKYGHLCASRCGVECRYCYKCAEKIEKVFKNKQKEMRKKTMSMCVMSENINLK